MWPYVIGIQFTAACRVGRNNAYIAVIRLYRNSIPFGWLSELDPDLGTECDFRKVLDICFEALIKATAEPDMPAVIDGNMARERKPGICLRLYCGV